MESSYGIGVANRYAVFLGEENEDPMDLISKKAQDEKKAKKPGEPKMTDSKSKDPADKKTKQPPVANATSGSKPANKPQPPPADKKTPKKSETKPGGQSSPASDQKGGQAQAPGSGKPAGENRPRNARIVRNSNLGDRTGERNLQNDTDRPPKVERITDQKEIDERKNRRNREDNSRPMNTDSYFRERTDFDKRGARGGRGRDGRGRGRGGGFDNRGKRLNDRQSGSDKSGVKPTDKRDGGGAHNWGNPVDDVADFETHEQAEKSGDENTLEVSDPNQEGETNAAEEETKEVVEEGPKEKTYDEWKREEDEKRVQPKFNLRKPGEGEDVSQWNKTFVLKKKESDEDEYEEIEVEVEEEEVNRKGKQKQHVDIQITFNRDETRGDFNRGRGGRGRGGDRGAPRGDRDGGRGRGRRPGFDSFGPRPERGRGQDRRRPPKVDDINDFPSLAAPTA